MDLKLALSISALAVAALGTSQTVSKPAAGSALRKSLMDAMRPSFEKTLKQKVIFKVDSLRVLGNWAYAHVHPIQPNSKPIDFSKTKYAEALKEGMFDGDSSYVLLKKKNGKWVVSDFVIGPTDVYWSNWMNAPWNAPKALFPEPYGKGD